MSVQIEFEAVRPDPARLWHRHQYGLRGTAWAVRGSYERVYYFDEMYVSGGVQDYLAQTLVSLAAVIRSEIEAAIDQPMKPEHADSVNEFLAWQRAQKGGEQ